MRFARMIRRLINSPRFRREHNAILMLTGGACGRTEWTECAWLKVQRRK